MIIGNILLIGAAFYNSKLNKATLFGKKSKNNV
jgi:CRISPR/Cas system CMR-associated protein Cmr5 small subunit